MTIEPISSAICWARARVLLHEGHLVARFDQLLGQVVPDLAAADDEHEHRLRPPRSRSRRRRRCRRSRVGADGARGRPARGAAGRRRDPGQAGRRQPEVARDGVAIRLVRHSVAMPSSRVRLGPDRVVDLGHDPPAPSASTASCAAMMLRLSPSVRARNRSASSAPARRSTSSSVPSPRMARARGSRRQAVERRGRDVEDDDLVAGPVEARPAARADAAAADDDDFHACSSGIGSRTTQTAHGAFCRMYGMVRPMAKSPPNRLR